MGVSKTALLSAKIGNQNNGERMGIIKNAGECGLHIYMLIH